jgi:hypothetical protein
MINRQKLVSLCRETLRNLPQKLLHRKKKRHARSIRLNSDAKRVLIDYAKTLDMTPDTPLFGGRKNGGRKAIARQTAWRI